MGGTFKGFGKAILLLLMGAGGLGILTASISLVLLGGQRLSLPDEQTIHATVGRLRQARPLDVFIYGCVFVLLFELAGAVAGARAAHAASVTILRRTAAALCVLTGVLMLARSFY